ncbi:MAG: MFS transporter [Spirochaetia bacterium]|nr:MFS transporter [Spirochaetia bacterium]
MIKNIAPDTKKFVIVMIIVGLGMAGDAMIYCLLPVAPESFHITVFQIGILLSVNRFVRLITNEISTSVVTRLNSDKPLVIAVCLSTFITLGYAIPWGFWWLLFLRILWGGCFSLLRIEGYIAALRYSKCETLSRYMAWHETIKGQIYGIITIISGVLADLISPRAVPVLLAALTAACLLFFKGGKANLMGVEGAAVDTAPRAGRGKVSNPKLLIVLGLVILVSATFATMMGTLRGRAIVDYILPGAGIAVGAATFAALFQVAGQVVSLSGPVIGYICDKIGRRKAFAIVFGIQLTIILMLALFRLWYIILAMFVVQLFSGSASQILRTSIAGEYARGNEQAVFMNRIATFQDMGSAMGPFLGYALYAGTGNFVFIAVIMIPCLLLSMFALRKIGKAT